MRLPESERPRRATGLVLYLVAMTIAAGLLAVVFLLPPLFDPSPETVYAGMVVGAVLALPPLLVYLWLPWVIDRYDPEPLAMLAVAVSWGAIGACGYSATINSLVAAAGTGLGGAEFGQALSACLSAPFTEEFFKGLGIFGIFAFSKREFDGVVDAIIYASFIALGFAAVENVLYYGRAATSDLAQGTEGVLATTVVLRGLLTPWLHPLFTSMTGIGFGLARESERPWVRRLAPLGGYGFAVILHMTWNTAATLSGMLVLLMLPLWLAFVCGFGVLLLVLVARKGRIIAEHLKDEVALGVLTPAEFELVTSAWARWRATFGWGGKAGRRFVEAAARLAMSKWHAARAWRGGTHTVSHELIGPLRQQLRRCRHEMSQALGRALPEPGRPEVTTKPAPRTE